MGHRHAIIYSGRSFSRWFTLCIVLFALIGSCRLQARQPTEYEVKAAFLLNFAKFVDWPPNAFADAKAPLVIGILGENPFGQALGQIVRGQMAQGRAIEIREFKREEDYSLCHVLFVSRSLGESTHDALSQVRERPILTVGEIEDFIRHGGAIEFALVNKTVRFDINSGAANAAGLRVSSKLLAVARSVLKAS